MYAQPMNADNNVMMARGTMGQGLKGGKGVCVCVLRGGGEWNNINN